MKVRNVALVGAFLFLAWFGNAAVLAFDRFGYEYPDQVSLGRLIGEMVSINPLSVVAGFFTQPFFAMINLVMLISLIVAMVADLFFPKQRTAVLAVVSVLASALGLLALSSLIESLRLGLDGEWLGEGWPVLEVFFFWAIALVAYSIWSVFESKQSQPLPPVSG